jgi:GH24 family phage-related lysozyme (muramidase)
MDLEKLQTDIIQEEGGMILEPYQDHLGYWTVGAGHLIRDHEKDELMNGITHQKGIELFLKDFNVAIDDAESFTEGMILDDNAHECIIHMVFQLGLPRLNKFVKFKKCLSENDIAGAMVEMKDSLWYRQTTNRANRIINKMEKSLNTNGGENGA